MLRTIGATAREVRSSIAPTCGAVGCGGIPAWSGASGFVVDLLRAVAAPAAGGRRCDAPVRGCVMICYKARSKQMPVRLFLCCAAPCEVAVVLRGWWEVMELVRAADYAARRCALFLPLLRCNDVRDALEEACPCKLLCLAAALLLALRSHARRSRSLHSTAAITSHSPHPQRAQPHPRNILPHPRRLLSHPQKLLSHPRHLRLRCAVTLEA